MLSPTFIIIIGIIVIIAIIYHFYKKIVFFQQETFRISTTVSGPRKSWWWWLSPFNTNPFLKAKIQQRNKKRRHKIRLQQRETFLKEVGLVPEKVAKTEFYHLKNMVRAYGRKYKDKPGFENIEQLAEKIKQWEENKPLPKKEVDKIIEELKKMSAKK